MRIEEEDRIDVWSGTWSEGKNTYWYAPIPEFPTPPNGALGTAACSMMSFMVTPPERVFLTM